MPLTYDQALYDILYNVDGPNGSRIHYTRELYDVNHDWVARRLTMVPSGLIANSNIVVVGCGFGWLIENLLDAGANNVVGVDPSPYVHANKAEHSRSDVAGRIVNATVGVDNVGSILQQAGFPATYNVVIDDDAASSNSDAELPAFLNGCEALLQGGQRARIIHLVTQKREEGGQDSAINWKFMAEWKALRTSHTWVNVSTGQVA